MKNFTAQKMKFSIKDFFGKCGQICSFLRIRSHFLEKSLKESFIFYAVIPATALIFKTKQIDYFQFPKTVNIYCMF